MCPFFFVGILFKRRVMSSKAIYCKSPLLHDLNIGGERSGEDFATSAALLLLNIVHVGVPENSK